MFDILCGKSVALRTLVCDDSGPILHKMVFETQDALFLFSKTHYDEEFEEIESLNFDNYGLGEGFDGDVISVENLASRKIIVRVTEIWVVYPKTDQGLLYSFILEYGDGERSCFYTNGGDIEPILEADIFKELMIDLKFYKEVKIINLS